MVDRCKAVNLRGEYEGLQCERKASKFGYCASHFRSKHIQKELEAQGIDINAKSSVSSIKPHNLLETKSAVISNPIKKKEQLPKPPKLTKTQLEEQREKAFAASFAANAQSKLECGDDFNILDVYNHTDIPDEDITEDVSITREEKIKVRKELLAADKRNLKREVENVKRKGQHVPQSIENLISDEPEEEIQIREVDPAIANKRRLAAVNFVKKMSNFGVFITCNIAESATPKLKGYTHALMTKDDYNTYLDEAAEAYADMLGLSDIAPEYKLLGLAGMVALEVISINNGLGQDIRMPTPKDYQENSQEKDFGPAYTE